MKIRKKEISLIKIIIICIILLLVISIVYIFVNANKEKTSINDFTSAQEVIEYLESEFISETKHISAYPTKIKLKFKYLPYNEDNTSNENYYNQMITMIAHVLSYTNFSLDDSENNITVKVECDRKEGKITNIYINDISNYFAIRNSEISLDNFVTINNINLNLESNELIRLISNDWTYSEDMFGTKDSYYENYDIFFDEGIQVRVINNEILTDKSQVGSNKVFNIVFNKKYKGKIVNNLSAEASLLDVVNVFGQPQFGTIESGLIGYKCERFYIFFNNNNEVSFYRNVNLDKTEFAKIVTKFIEEKNSVNLIDRITEIWPDYDIYNENVQNQTKELVYTLYGVKIQFNVTNEHGIILYNDFSGKVTEDISFDEILNKSKEIPNYVYVKNTSLVHENEIRRSFSALDLQFMKQTDKFIAYAKAVGNSESISIKFISQTDEYPNSELLNLVNTYEWADDVNFIYSRKNIGIYIYNVVTKEEKIVIEGNDSYNITKYENGVLTYDDNKQIKINI